MKLDDFSALLLELSRIDAPPGYEDPLRAWLQAHLPAGATARVDGLGNLIVLREPARQPRAVVVAPLDEVGFLSQEGPAPGWVRLAPLGPAPLPGPAGARVRFANAALGVLVREPHTSDDAGWRGWLCDVAAAQVPVGTPGVWDAAPVARAGRVWGKALGVRAALLVALWALHHAEPAHPTAWVFAAREQVPGHGSAPAAFGLQPAWAWRVMPAPAGDLPGQRVPGPGVGRGPAVRLREWGRAADPRLVQALQRAAAQVGFTPQAEVPPDREPSWASLPLVAAGLPTATLSLPVRNLHAAHESVALDDLTLAARWLRQLLEAPGDPLA